jgi:hypothetical protein
LIAAGTNSGRPGNQTHLGDRTFFTDLSLLICACNNTVAADLLRSFARIAFDSEAAVRRRLRVTRARLRPRRDYENHTDQSKFRQSKPGGEILCHTALLRSVFVLIAKLLIVVPAAPVAAGERFFEVHSRVLPLNIFESGIHLA